VWVRLTRNVGISVNAGVLLALLPFLLAAWTVYAVVLIVYGLARLAVEGIEGAARRIEGRQSRRR
jgi:hypothetical protein